MDPVEHDLIEGLVTERSLDRYLVYADHLQTRGDLRGELIALEVHARQTGHADPKTRELQAQIEQRMGISGVTVFWELGFVDTVWVDDWQLASVDELFADPALAIVRSLAIVGGNPTPFPVDRIARAPFSRTLARVAVGSVDAPASTIAVDELIARLPALTGLELRGKNIPDDELLKRLEAFERLEELALWMIITPAVHQRLIEGPWLQLRSLSSPLQPRGGSALPAYLDNVLDGVRYPQLAELAIVQRGHSPTFEQPLIEALANRPLGERLTRLGLNWRHVEDRWLEDVQDEFAGIEIFGARPTGEAPTPDAEYQLARRLRIGLDRDRLALEHARRACELEANYFHWIEVGYCLETLDRLPEAIAAMDQAITFEPKRWGARTAKGAALRDLSRFDEAQVEYEIALAADPKRVQIHNGLGLLHARRGNLAQAVEAFDRAAEVAPDDRATYDCNAIEVWIEHGYLAEANARWARARGLSPDDARLRGHGGYLRLFAGQAAEALGAVPEPEEGADDRYFVMALHAAARRELADRVAAAHLYREIAKITDCPSYIAFAWLGLATLGIEDPLAAIAARDPGQLADEIARTVNAARGPGARVVHTTEDRCDDRIHVAVCAVVAAIAAGRGADARELADALAAFLDGPATVKHNHWWLELYDLVRYTESHAGSSELAELAHRTYAIATGREPPR